MKIQRAIAMNENQRRAIGIALTGLDEVLCGVEAWALGHEADGVLHKETNDLSTRQKQALEQGVVAIRQIIKTASADLGLRKTRVRASAAIWGRCCALRDTLSELGAKHLKGYGEMSPELRRYMDDLSARLLNAVDRLVEETGRQGQGA